VTRKNKEAEGTMEKSRSSHSIDDYIKTFPKDVREKLQALRKTIKKAAPSAEETISYGIPTFDHGGHLVHFAAYKKHIGFYPTSSGIQAFKKELSIYKTSKGTVQFPVAKPLPLALVSKIVKFRVAENIKNYKENLKIKKK
jgi:uncharacterized protein YdhG (YjbR/CyaY superfamily)